MSVAATGIDGSLKLMERAYRQYYSLGGSALPIDLARRGFEFDDDPLPGYLYREDATRFWDIIEDYCNECVIAMYDSDAKVLADPQLQVRLAFEFFASTLSTDRRAFYRASFRSWPVPGTTAQACLVYLR